jgi:hypothetical protein
VIGMRAPHLKPGRNTQFEVIVYWLNLQWEIRVNTWYEVIFLLP